jgi:hypothetical protein
VTDSSLNRRYVEPQPYSREQAERAFQSGDLDAICHALVGVAFHDPDRQWVQDQCVRLSTHPSSDVRGLVATCFGHLARIHRSLDWAVVEPVLACLSADADPEVRGRVDDARSDFEMFLGRRHGDHLDAAV